MTSLAYQSTKWTLDLVTRLIKAKVRFHNAGVVKPDMAVVFTVNHFTRLETLLLPYEIIKHTGREPWALASEELFHGGLKSYLNSMGAISTKDPDRDTIVVRSLLEGVNPWVIFPEGRMVKDKKVVDDEGSYVINTTTTQRPPHRGAAILALRAEFYRQKLARVEACPQNAELLSRFNLESAEGLVRKRTVIIPVNITYYPIRARDNFVLRLANVFAKELSPRAVEELSVEGTILGEDTDIDISLGAPIDIAEYLNAPEMERLVAECSEATDAEARTLQHHIAELSAQIMQRYMRDIYGMTVINYDHIFASLVRYIPCCHFTDQMFRNRVFLAVRGLLDDAELHLHPRLRSHYRDSIYGEPCPELDDFLRLCLDEATLTKEGPFYRKKPVEDEEGEYHTVRARQATYVIANEIEPVRDAAAHIRAMARMAEAEVVATVRQTLIDEDLGLFDRDWARFEPEPDRAAEVGRPFLLVPNRIRAGVVLTHGYLAAPKEVRALAEFLYRRGYAVYGVRLKGHGTAPEDLADAKWKDWYDSLNRGVAVMRTYTERLILGGFSFGGGLSLLAAARKAIPVTAVFAINTPLRLSNVAIRLVPTMVTMNTLLRRVKRQGFRWEYVRSHTENPGTNYSRNPLAAVRQFAHAMEAVEAALGEVTAPVLLIQGSDDPVVQPESGKLLFDLLTNSARELTLVPRDRHGIINGEGATDIFEHVRFFLDAVIEDARVGQIVSTKKTLDDGTAEPNSAAS